MFENLTYYIPLMEKSDYGKWVNRGPYPFVLYEWDVRRLRERIGDFAEDHKGTEGIRFCRILEENDLSWSRKSMKGADVSALDGRTVFALLMAADEAESCCEGAFLEFCESGCVLRWLRRLKEIDDEEKGKPAEAAC